MPRISLKTIIGKKNETASLLLSLIEQLNATVTIYDHAGNILLGEEQNNNSYQHPVIASDEQIGMVAGDEKAIVIASLLNHLCQKEAEKKKLGAEVLNLYQEINLIFNFSEKLAHTIDAPSICSITLNEARRIISSDNGAVVLWDEETKKLKIVASSGNLFFDEERINKELPVLLDIILSGQSEIITDTNSLVGSGIAFAEVKSIIYSSLKVNQRVRGAIVLGKNETIQYAAADLKLLTTLALQSSAAIESSSLYERNIREAREREEAMRLVFEVTDKFVPYEFIRSLGHKLLTDVKLGDQVEKTVTVLFSDIRDYTGISEQMTPEENFKFVCSFNERMGPIIRQNNGFINQYLGDAIMAIFPRNASDALCAAIDMQREVEELNNFRHAHHQAPIKIGIGMHTGPLIMGITGDKDRMDATTISDTVNTASRLESLSKHYRTSIILSDACVKQLEEKEKYHLRYLGLVKLKGKHEPLHIHECFNTHTPCHLEKKLATLSVFNEGVSHYLNNTFHEAAIAFKKVLDSYPEDDTAHFFLLNAKSKMETSKPERLSGVVEMAHK